MAIEHLQDIPTIENFETGKTSGLAETLRIPEFAASIGVLATGLATLEYTSHDTAGKVLAGIGIVGAWHASRKIKS